MLCHRSNPDLNLEDDDPWSWDVAQPSAPGRKKRQAQRTSSLHPDHHHSVNAWTLLKIFLVLTVLSTTACENIARLPTNDCCMHMTNT